MDVLKPGQAMPPLTLPLVGGQTFDLSRAAIDKFLFITVYRGFHCPICRNYTHQLATQQEAFKALGVSTMLVSADHKDKAEQAKDEWHLGQLPVAYDLPIEVARQWGLYISQGRGPKEPALFTEPGLFLIEPGPKLYGAYVQSLPFARPDFRGLLKDFAYIIEHQYGARGTA